MDDNTFVFNILPNITGINKNHVCVMVMVMMMVVMVVVVVMMGTGIFLRVTPPLFVVVALSSFPKVQRWPRVRPPTAQGVPDIVSRDEGGLVCVGGGE